MIRHPMVLERLTLIQEAADVLEGIARLPEDQFTGDLRNPATAESYLRRALEAIFDVGRHLLAASGQASLAAEYKSIANSQPPALCSRRRLRPLPPSRCSGGEAGRLAWCRTSVRPEPGWEAVVLDLCSGEQRACHSLRPCRR
ncbi:MAG: hypothetical protein Q8P31_02495 [Bacillota bacterium]|nr:hypothetical protein [Bacillota bacterium]